MLVITKESLQKKARERFQNISEKEKEKRINMVAHHIKTFLNMKRKGWFSKQKIIMKFVTVSCNSFSNHS